MSVENKEVNWEEALKLDADKTPRENTAIEPENLKYYLTHSEYNILLLAVQSLIEDYSEQLEAGFPGSTGSSGTYWDSYRVIKKGATTPASDSTLYTSLMTLEKLKDLKAEIQGIIDNLDEKYLSKINPDTANELITFLKGLEVTDVGGKDKINITPKRLSFQHEGELGWGDTQYYIDSEGYAHLKGLILEEYLEVPELRYNRIEINIGDSWRAPGGGVILDVVESSSTAGTVTLKLDDGELGAVSEDDLCMGIYHFIGDGKVNNAAKDTDNFETGEREIQGFATSYFQILTVSEDHTSFTYRLRPGYTVHPQPTMNFVGFGNVTNKNRQTSSYQTRTYQRYMINRDDWSYTMANISAQFGDLTTLGGDYDEYSAYLNNVYFTGKIEQIIADKIEVRLDKEKISVEKDASDQYILGPQITSNTLSVMEGDRLLTPTNNTVEGDLKAGEYFISVEGVGITPGAVSINTVDRNIAIGDSSNMTTDIARIMYTIKLKRANGKSESIAKYQEISFLKGIPGEPGEPGNPGTDGTPGDDGSGIASVVLKHAFSTNGDSKPYEDGNTNWISGIPTNTSSQKGKYLWVQTITTYTKGVSTTYSYTVSYIPKDGEKGDPGTDGTDGTNGTDGTPGTDGTDSVSVTASKEGHTYTFYSTSSPTPKGAWSDGKSTLSVYKGTQKLTYTTGVLGDTNYTVSVNPTPNATNGIKIGSESSNFFVYPEKLPTDIINIILTIKVKGITGEFTKVLTYSRLNDGVSGVGVPIVYRGTWDVTKTYYGNDKRMDIVKYDDHYWKAKNVTGSSTAGFTGVSTKPGSSSSHWDSFGAEFESVATELLLAEKANIASFAFEKETIYSQSGYIVDGLGNYTGVTTSDGRLDNPLFKSNLYLNGKTGELQARTGYIGGFTIHKDMLQSTHGTTPSILLNGITGQLIANDAIIKGRIEAVTGDIGGFEIEGEKLITYNAGLSGVDGYGRYPAIWGGGTYEGAKKFIQLLEAIKYDAEPPTDVANFVVNHSGATKMGVLITEESGKVNFADINTAKTFGSIDNAPIPKYTDLIANAYKEDIKENDAITFDYSQTSYILPNTVYAVRANGVIEFRGTATFSGLVPYRGSAQVELILRKDGFFYKSIYIDLFKNIIREPDAASLPFNNTTVINERITDVPVGRYSVEFKANYNLVHSSTKLELSKTYLEWVYTPYAIKRTQIGNNGFMAWYGSDKHFYVSDTEGVKIKGFEAERTGAVVVGLGRVSSGASISSNYNSPDFSLSVSKNGVGKYKFAHNLNTNIYSCQVTATQAARSASIILQDGYYTEIETRNEMGDLADSSFSYTFTKVYT